MFLSEFLFLFLLLLCFCLLIRNSWFSVSLTCRSLIKLGIYSWRFFLSFLLTNPDHTLQGSELKNRFPIKYHWATISHLSIIVKNTSLIKIICGFLKTLILDSSWTSCHFYLSGSIIGLMNIPQFLSSILKERVQCDRLRNTIRKYPLVCIVNRHAGLLTAIYGAKLPFNFIFSNYKHYNFM